MTQWTEGAVYAGRQINAEAGPFVALEDGKVAHVCRGVTEPSHHAIVSRNQVGYCGPIPPCAIAAFEQALPFALFVESAADTFVFVGWSRCVMLRAVGGKPWELSLYSETGLSTELLQALAPEVIDQVEPTAVSVDVFIELRRAGGEWTAVASDLAVEARGKELGEALAEAEAQAAAETQAAGEALARGGTARPDTSGMKRVEAGYEWPWADIERAQRVVVRVNVFSADLEVPGWSLCREECWY